MKASLEVYIRTIVVGGLLAVSLPMAAYAAEPVSSEEAEPVTAESLAADIQAELAKLPEDATEADIKAAIDAIIATAAKNGVSEAIQQAALIIVFNAATQAGETAIANAVSNVSTVVPDDTTGGVPGGNTDGGTIPISAPPDGGSAGGSDY